MTLPTQSLFQKVHLQARTIVKNSGTGDILLLFEYGKPYTGRIGKPGEIAAMSGADFEYTTPMNVTCLPKRLYPEGELEDLIDNFGEPRAWPMSNQVYEARQNYVAHNANFINGLM